MTNAVQPSRGTHRMGRSVIHTISILLLVTVCLFSFTAFALDKDEKPQIDFIEPYPQRIEGTVVDPHHDVHDVRDKHPLRRPFRVPNSFLEELLERAYERSSRQTDN